MSWPQGWVKLQNWVKKAIRNDSIWIGYDMIWKWQFLERYTNFDFENIFLIKLWMWMVIIQDYHFMIPLYTKYQFHLVFHWVQNYWFDIILSTKIDYNLRTEICNNVIFRYLKKIMFCIILFCIKFFLSHHSWLEW